jgi:hypothetical protein
MKGPFISRRPAAWPTHPRPIASTLLIADNRVVQRRRHGNGVDLGANPVARVFVDSFMMLLAGDRTLERIFTMKFSPASSGAGGRSARGSSRWCRAPPMNKIHQGDRAAGQGLIIREMEVREQR